MREIEHCVPVILLGLACLTADGTQPPQGEDISSGRTLRSWIEALRDPDPAAREQAGYALSQTGPAAREAVPELIRLVNEEKADKVRLAAVSALGWIGHDALPAVPVLRAILRDEESNAVRWRAATALGQIGPEAVNSVPELTCAIIVDDVSGVRTGAAFALRRIGERGLPALILGLIFPNEDPINSPRDENSRTAPPAEALAAEGKTAAPALVRALVDLTTLSSEDIGEKWLKAIEGDGSDWLAKRLRDRNEGSFDSIKSDRIIEVLSRIGRDAVPAILKMFDHSDDQVKRSAVLTLANIGPAAGETLPVLLRLFERSMANFILREPLVAAITEIGPGRDDVAQVLMSVLKNPDPFARADVVRHLGGLAYRDASWLQILAGCLSDQNLYVRYTAASVLAPIAPDHKDLIPTLLDLLKRDDQNRQSAIHLLGDLGPRAAAAIEPLCQWLKDGDSYVRRAAASALGDIARGSSSAVKALRAAIQDPDPRVRSNAIDSLGEIGPAARAALPDLLPLIDEPDVDLCRSAARAIKAIDADTAADLGIL